MEHTPGPWEVAQFGDDGNGFIGYQIWNRAGGEVSIIRIAVNQHHDPQYADFVARCQANARLIAAAPELLRELTLVLQAIPDRNYDVLASARAAIKAAKGD